MYLYSVQFSSLVQLDYNFKAPQQSLLKICKIFKNYYNTTLIRYAVTALFNYHGQINMRGKTNSLHD